MNLFLLALARDRVAPAVVTSALRDVAGQLPYFNGASMHEHSSGDGRLAVSWISHRPELVGGVEYSAQDGEMLALFSGRPILAAEGGFDGVSPLDPGLYLKPGQWEHRLDGRYAIVRCEGGRQVSVTTDPLGAYRVFTLDRDGVRWIGNNADAVALAGRASGFDTLALASLLTFGWSFGGRPLRDSVRRLAPNATHTFHSEPASWSTQARPDLMAAIPPEFNPRHAADVLVGTTRAFMDWPDRRLTVSVTGGRDSRLTFAAASSGSQPFRAKTITSPHDAGFPESGDVKVARALCDIAGIAHHVEIGSPVADLRRSAETLSTLTSGAISGGDVGTPPVELPPGPLEVHVTGAGGEIARCYYGSAFGTASQAGEAVTHHHIHSVPAPLVSEPAVALVRQWVRDWMARRGEEGVPVAALGDAFYLEERMGSWAAAGQGAYEYWGDTVCPLWTASLSPLMLACPAAWRHRDGFHNLVLRELSPELWKVPFAGTMPDWPLLRENRLASARLTAAYRKLRLVQSEIMRRLERRRRDTSEEYDPIVDAQALVRELSLASPNHAAWDILDRGRTERMLRVDPRGMHPRGRHQIWRLLAVFSEQS
jgi:hypothetical protein